MQNPTFRNIAKRKKEKIMPDYNPRSELIRLLLKFGYGVADDMGIRQDIKTPEDYKECNIGILQPRTKAGKVHRDYHVGNVYMRGDEWTLEVFGKGNSPQLSQIVGQIAMRHNIRIDLMLGSEKPYSEAFPEDYSW